MSRWLKYSGVTAGEEDECCSEILGAESSRTVGRGSAQVADELLSSVDEDAPGVDISPTALTPRRSNIPVIDDWHLSLLGSQRRKRLDDEAEGELRGDGKVVGVREVVGRHAEEARVAVACVESVSVGSGTERAVGRSGPWSMATKSVVARGAELREQVM